MLRHKNYHASDMVLAIHSDAGYLNVEDARSRAGGHHFLSENVDNPANNGAIYNEASIIKSVMSSAAEAEIGALYINARKGDEIRNILKLPFKQIIRQRKASSTYVFNQSARKPWIFVFIGCAIGESYREMIKLLSVCRCLSVCREFLPRNPT